MKRFRIFSVIVFILAILVAGFYKGKDLVGVDRLGPMINVEGGILDVSIKDYEDTLMQGVTATDSKDGDVTGSIVIENVSGFLDDNRRIVTYAAFDSDHNIGKVTRQIRYTDYTSPEFMLNAPLQFPVGAKSEFLMNVGAMDCIDGDISQMVHISRGYVFTTEVETEYQMQLEVTNSLGDRVVLPVTVTIYDPSEYAWSPHIILTQYILYIDAGTHPNLRYYIKDVENQKTEATVADVDVDDSGIDYNTPGVYEALYRVADDGFTNQVRMVVVVR